MRKPRFFFSLVLPLATEGPHQRSSLGDTVLGVECDCVIKIWSGSSTCSGLPKTQLPPVFSWLLMQRAHAPENKINFCQRLVRLQIQGSATLHVLYGILFPFGILPISKSAWNCERKTPLDVAWLPRCLSSHLLTGGLRDLTNTTGLGFLCAVHHRIMDSTREDLIDKVGKGAARR